ncbi:hypothetical protein N7462_001338 [Penicillium macrosclerotiorum]|uniref:uncharacterized protein n=1 Tax=Penicillium macrosclerotiorum TaxID=303699 RepID=UPI002547325A|nr:uncharacterized protein N7462_001338 [Penicillium macrosclerotiorum]KAJ5691915.1 hypothetical protein N7462_001338 [Penicillium macrosclerotiorum]
MALAQPNINSFQIGLFATHTINYVDLKAILDEQYEIPSGFTTHSNDPDAYIFGRVGKHNIVISLPPRGSTIQVAHRAPHLICYLKSFRVGLSIGIADGLGKVKGGMKQGDVLVSHLMQEQDGTKYRHNNFGNKIPSVLAGAVLRVQTRQEMYGPTIPESLTKYVPREPKTYDGTVVSCKNSMIIRQMREVITDQKFLCSRDDEEEFFCFEQEGEPRLSTSVSCLVVRGICISNNMQRHASATATAYTKELLIHMPKEDVRNSRLVWVDTAGR